jgi:hypothetical protein
VIAWEILPSKDAGVAGEKTFAPQDETDGCIL